MFISKADELSYLCIRDDLSVLTRNWIGFHRAGRLTVKLLPDLIYQVRSCQSLYRVYVDAPGPSPRSDIPSAHMSEAFPSLDPVFRGCFRNGEVPRSGVR